ncbi:MAG: hypothetical protein JWM16_2312 [Verrucomicrobiales bacterium]|nr:hypothetical protein [Verrucomicrobiales bacterium]
MAEDVEGSTLVDLIAQPGEQSFASLPSVVFDEDFPCLRLGGLDPGQDVRREQRPGAVVVGSVAFGVEPAVTSQVGADFSFEGKFAVEVHWKVKVRESVEDVPIARQTFWFWQAASHRMRGRECPRMTPRPCELQYASLLPWE